MTPAENPYLSLVVAARYDDHGGNFMRRMQAFLNAFIEQCRRHKLPAEVLVVEWNPLPDRCGLAQALEWPVEPGAMDWCKVRFIEVPPAIHSRFKHGDKLPLYQMIAKNVAIRRARGEWILATNIDIFFNEQLMSFLAQRQLHQDRMYRIDRHDAGDGFPLWATAAGQLAYCEDNLLRISARESTFTLNKQGHRAWSGTDIVDAAQVGLGEGWYPPELNPTLPIRYFEDGALLQIPPQPAPTTLVLWLEPGINAAGPLNVRVERQGDATVVLAAASLASLSSLRVPIPQSTGHTVLRLRADATWRPRIGGLRKLTARAWSVSLGETFSSSSRALARSFNFADHAAIWMRTKVPAVHAVIAPIYRTLTGRSNATEHLDAHVPTAPPEFLHTNACGDFTLLHRDAWLDLRGYPEFDAYSMNIDSVLCWAAHYAGYRELVLADPMRIYHMEHGQGSGWTPEGAQILYKRITGAGLPWLEYSELVSWVDSMRAWKRPILFNGADWGLANDELRETAPDLNASGLRWCKDDPESPSRKASKQ